MYDILLVSSCCCSRHAFFLVRGSCVVCPWYVRMTHYFNKVGWPSAAPADEAGRKDFVAGLHKLKTGLFMDLVDTGALPLRPGVAR